MNLYSINCGGFKLDGGAMFGVVPKSIWQKTNPADALNMCNWVMRSLLIEDQNRLILIDTGMGNKQSEKFFGHYYLHGNDSLEGSLKKHGFSKNDITDVFLTHLHFDHCGGAITYNQDKTFMIPNFPNATYWSNDQHWKWATIPNPREKASFLMENILPIEESGQLKMISAKQSLIENVFPNISVQFVDGHTDRQMLPIIKYKDKTILYMADLLPSVGHIPLPYVMGYDTRPLITVKEKEEILQRACDKNWILFFEHDAIHECGILKNTEKGPRIDHTFTLNDI